MVAKRQVRFVHADAVHVGKQLAQLQQQMKKVGFEIPISANMNRLHRRHWEKCPAGIRMQQIPLNTVHASDQRLRDDQRDNLLKGA